MERQVECLKKEKIIYLTAFLAGVVGTNILESKSWIQVGYLHRYQLLQLSYSELQYERYLIELLAQRLKLLILLWLLGKVIPSRQICCVFGIFFFLCLGSILTCMLLANGLFGLLLFIGMLFPQWIFYICAFMWWKVLTEHSYIKNDKKKKSFSALLLVLLVIVGCMTEAYINPYIFLKIIK